MKSTHFDVLGFSRTYCDFYVGFGLFVTVFLLLAGGISLAARRSPGRDVGDDARRRLGSPPLLCSNHGLELEILLYSSLLFFSIVITVCLFAAAWRSAKPMRSRSLPAG